MKTLPECFSPDLLLPLLAILVFLCSFIQWMLWEARKHSNSPGPASYPIIGSLLAFYKNRNRLLDWYTEMLSASPTQTIIISRLGARRTIVTANPRNVEYVLKTNFSNFPKGKPFTEMLRDFLGNGIFNVDGDLWYYQRKLAIRQFSARSLREYVGSILKEEVEQKLLPLLESAAETKLPLDLQDLLRRLAFDIACRFSLGYDPCCLDSLHSLDSSHPIVEAFDVASEMCARRGAAPLSSMWKAKRLFNLGSEKQLREATSRIRGFIDEIIRQKRSIIRSKLGVTDGLVSEMAMDGRGEEEVRDTILSIIMAGGDTTSSAMTWLFHTLSRHPEVENTAVKELGSITTNLSKLESLKELKWLKACICESMRLFPPVAWDSKHAVANDWLPDGTGLRSGDRVTYFPYGMGRMEVLWGKDWSEFKPERWIHDNHASPYKFPVFQAGPRVCLGKEMAVVQITYLVASIMRRFRIRPINPDHRPVYVPLLTAHMAGGFKAFVLPR